VVLNCAAQAEVTEQVLRHYQADSCAGVILTKVDEAVSLGPTLDAVIRHRLCILGVADGQAIPDDWGPADADRLIATALVNNLPTALERDIDELLVQMSVQDPGRPKRNGQQVARSVSIAGTAHAQ
jgi:flagellar biosynthesis protein FlhF